jgi:hypothetical protein
MVTCLVLCLDVVLELSRFCSFWLFFHGLHGSWTLCLSDSALLLVCVFLLDGLCFLSQGLFSVVSLQFVLECAFLWFSTKNLVQPNRGPALAWILDARQGDGGAECSALVWVKDLPSTVLSAGGSRMLCKR